MTGAIQKWRSDEEAQKTLSWLSTLDFHEKHRNLRSIQHPDTGAWFLEHEKFLAWRDGITGTPCGFWCTGNSKVLRTPKFSELVAYVSSRSGCRQVRSTVCDEEILPFNLLIGIRASVIEHLHSISNSNNATIAYVFCSWQERSLFNYENVLGAIVKQTAETSLRMPLTIMHYYKAYKNGRRSPSLQNLREIFRELMKPFSRVFIVADGLDECGSTDSRSQSSSNSAQVIESTLLSLLHDDFPDSLKVRLLTSSRSEPTLIDRTHDFEVITISVTTEELRTVAFSELESQSISAPWINPQLGQRVRQDAKLWTQIAEQCVASAGNS